MDDQIETLDPGALNDPPEAEEVSYEQIAETLTPILQPLGLTAYVAQTGGGTATVIVTREGGEEGIIAIGPGSYDWATSRASTFWLGGDALCVGIDGAEDATYVNTREELAAAAMLWLRIAADEDDDAVTACEFCGGETCRSCGWTGEQGHQEGATPAEEAALVLRAYNRIVRKNGPTAVSGVATDDTGEAYDEVVDVADLLGFDVSSIYVALVAAVDAYQSKLRAEAAAA